MQWIVVLCALILAVGCSIQEPDIIGGERDDFGCLGAAGYAYDEDLGACIRSFELSETDRITAAIALAEIDIMQPTVASVMQEGCPECYIITIQDPEFNAWIVTVENRTVSDIRERDE